MVGNSQNSMMVHQTGPSASAAYAQALDRAVPTAQLDIVYVVVSFTATTIQR